MRTRWFKLCPFHPQMEVTNKPAKRSCFHHPKKVTAWITWKMYVYQFGSHPHFQVKINLMCKTTIVGSSSSAVLLGHFVRKYLQQPIGSMSGIFPYILPSKATKCRYKNTRHGSYGKWNPPKNKLKTFTSYHVATLPILPPVTVLHFATITTRRMMSPSDLKNLDQRISPPGWEEANPIFFQFQGDTLQGTITYPTKREREDHLPKCRLVGDMFVPRRDMWSFPVSFFFSGWWVFLPPSFSTYVQVNLDLFSK